MGFGPGRAEPETESAEPETAEPAARGRRRRGLARRRSPRSGDREPRLQRAQAPEQVVDRRGRRKGAQLEERHLEERARGLGAAQIAAALDREGERRAQVVGVELRGLRRVALAVGRRGVHEPLERPVHGEQHELAQMVREPVGDLLHVHAAVVESVHCLERLLRTARGDRLAQVEEGIRPSPGALATASAVTPSGETESAWSSRESASRTDPSEARAMGGGSGSSVTFSAAAIVWRCATSSSLRSLAELEDLAARGDRVRDLERLGRREDEPHVRGRLFQRLQERVPGEVGELVGLVDDVDLGLPARYFTFSRRFRISSIPRFDAPSISSTSRSFPP